MRTREIRLASRPKGWPEPADFDLAETDLPEPAEGQVLVRNLFMSVDPYMRGRMNDVESYVPPYRLGEPIEGGAVGEVVDSRAPGLAKGDVVLHNHGWREHALLDARAVRKVPDVPGVSPSAYLGVLGMPGLTAYAGLLDVAGFKEGDAVFVSGAAGAVGSLVGQIARLKGASRVIGSAGSAAKVAFLTERLGFDAAFNYRDAPVAEQLAAAAPDGIDVYFDNVGADHLEAAIGALRPHGRVALCGAIAVYNRADPQPGPRNLSLAIGRRLTLRGFIVGDHFSRMPAMVDEVGAWLREGRIVYQETVADGLDNAPAAFIGMLRGENVGKMIVRL
ncbi:NADP-dependent oxidoreductase [Microbispora sp. ATCC PTA-5024]|uniref:NADP-dependent oxidoreductase n=1 Tax=Microbispora sp. ATCC PTA-5024 TaxID=316330 RepID=UPI0003DC102A|nr:NADP-dependent oxidoreductase [Microbispora sp. ATCC PTA-5024]ETK31706.1 NADP-dependent oxidoreductase [Microbispora sp. ATCC PTA-5024]